MQLEYINKHIIESYRAIVVVNDGAWRNLRQSNESILKDLFEAEVEFYSFINV